MPLIDSLSGYGNQRVGVARDALDPYNVSSASSPSAGLTALLDKLKAGTSTPDVPKVDFSKILDSLTSSASGAAGGLLSLRTPDNSLTAPQTGTAALKTSVGQSPIIGTKNYLTGKGAPALRMAAQNTAAMFGWDQSQFNAWDAIINAESGWRPNAQNPTSTAFGLGQFLDSTWKGYGPKTADPSQQLAYMARYIKDRYGTPEKALAFHQAHNWY